MAAIATRGRVFVEGAEHSSMIAFLNKLREIGGGYVTVVVRGDDVTYFFAGDATYDEANLRNEKADGVTNDPAQSIATLRAIKQFASSEPTIVLPAHDPEGPARLAQKRVYR